MNPSSLLEGLAILTDAPEGIKRLRELILQLAVRGRLVPQDQEDEPASELLKRIEREKAELVRAKKIREPKSLAVISPDELPAVIPAGWVATRLGEVVNVVRGITFPSSAKSKSPGPDRLACLRTTNVQDHLEWDDLLYIPIEYMKSDEQRLQRNDIVMSTANSRELVGKVALAEDERFDVTFGGFLAVIRPLQILPRFLMAVLRCPDSREKLIGSATQTTNIANISMGRLNPFVLCIPPLAEQHRIVAKVDELMGLLDELERARDEREARRSAFRDSALAALQNAEDTQAAQAAWTRIATNLVDCLTDPADIAPLRQTILQLAVGGSLVPFLSHESSRIMNLDEVLAKISNGLNNAQTMTPGSIRVSRIETISTGSVDLNRTKWLADDIDDTTKDKFRLREGDILFSHINSIEHLGKTAIIEHSEQPLYHGVNLLRLQPDRSVILPRYLFWNLRAKWRARDFYAHAKHAVQQVSVNQKTLSRIQLRVPCMAEQEIIVDKIDELMAVCDELEQQLTEAKAHQSAFAAAAVHHLDLAPPEQSNGAETALPQVQSRDANGAARCSK